MSYGALTIAILLAIALALLPAVFASRKGYAWYLWILAGWLVGLVVIAFLPFANRQDVPPDQNRKRRQRGNLIGAFISAIAVMGFIYSLSQIPNPPWSKNSLAQNLVSQYIAIAPVLLASMIGIVLGVPLCRKSRRTGGMVIIAASIFLLTNISSPLITQLVVRYAKDSALRGIFQDIGFAYNTLVGIAILLVCWAPFVSWSAATVVSSSTNVNSENTGE